MLRCACRPAGPRHIDAPHAACAVLRPWPWCHRACGRQVRRAAAAHRRHRAQRAQGPAQPAARRLGAGARPRTRRRILAAPHATMAGHWQYPMRHGCATMAGRAVPHATTHRTFPARTGRLFVCLFVCLFVGLFVCLLGVRPLRPRHSVSKVASPRTGGTCVWRITCNPRHCPTCRMRRSEPGDAPLAPTADRAAAAQIRQ
jgi:hypothetical protein